MSAAIELVPPISPEFFVGSINRRILYCTMLIYVVDPFCYILFIPSSLTCVSFWERRQSWPMFHGWTTRATNVT